MPNSFRFCRARLPRAARIAIAAAVLAVALPAPARSGVAYEDPGWDYSYEGAADDFGVNDFNALDGQWEHTQSDKWDGSAPGPGAGAPGGVVALTEGDVTYLRIQDTGNPLEWGFEEPSNRRFFFGHDIDVENPGATSSLTNGMTITFRARLSSTGVFDDIYPDLVDSEPEFPNYTDITPWPAAKGYNVKDDGKGMFTIQENSNNALGFALALDIDTFNGVAGNVGGGLVMNNKPTVILPGSDRGHLTTVNLVPFSDAQLLDWHEFWITIRDANLDGDYEVDVYADGSATPSSFVANSSIGAEYDGDYISFGLPSESSFGAVDVDFFAYRLGIVTPVPEPDGAAPGVTAALGLTAASFARCTRRSSRRAVV